MSDLKISDAAKQLVSSFVDDNAWNSLSAHWKETASRTAQGIINSEIDRIAGPLVEALSKMACICDDDGVSDHRAYCDRKIADEALANYRKERGE